MIPPNPPPGYYIEAITVVVAIVLGVLKIIPIEAVLIAVAIAATKL